MDEVIGEAAAESFDGLVLPGGVANPDFLRIDERAVAFVTGLLRPGPAGRRDLPRPVDPRRGGRRPRPGAHLLAESAHRHPQRGRHLGRRAGQGSATTDPNTLITSRKPDDLKAFCEALVNEFGKKAT